MTPVEKFSTTTSAVATSSRATATPSGDFRFSAMLRLLRLVQMNGAPPPNAGTMGGYCRKSSPFPGASTLITSAPISARIIVANGPAMKCVKSTTLRPCRARSAPLGRGWYSGKSDSSWVGMMLRR